MDTAATIKVRDESLRVECFQISPNGLRVFGHPKFGQWEKLAQALRLANGGVQFAIGDMVEQAEGLLHEEASQIIDAADWDRRTVEEYRWVARNVPYGVRRMDKLGIRHHQLVAKESIPVEQKAHWLNLAADSADGPWTVARMRQAMIDGGDTPVTQLWVLVSAQDSSDQAGLMALLESQGRSVKAVTRRGRKEKA